MRKFLFIFICLAFPAISFGANVDDIAPDFTLPLLKHSDMPITAITLSDYRGKVVYLDFWASWCGPCQISIPLINELRNKYQHENFEVLAINVDSDPEDGLYFLEDHPVSYPVISDPEGQSPALYEIMAMPSSFLIDAEGKIRQIHIGFTADDIFDIEADLLELIEENR